ncbi:uncharacterized protein [Branchiostoma lanceolatum]|uniref:uncharacterized protein n=1 Tax=Branchiostoma lanceolatum TaxID=7740 RepID=UPI003452D2FC
MAANRKSKLSTRRKRGGTSPSLGSLAVGSKNRKAEGSIEGHTDRIPAQNSAKTKELSESGHTGVTTEMVGLRQRLAAHWPIYNWENLSDLPPVKTGSKESQGLEQKHETCSILGTLFNWSPLPPPCKQCFKRKRVEFSPELLKNTEGVSRRESVLQSAHTARSFTKPTLNTSIKGQNTRIQVLPFHSKEKPTPTNVGPTKAPQVTPTGDMKRKTNLQENEIDQTAPIVTHVRGVSSDVVLSSLKSQGAIKTAGSQLSMHKDAERDRPKYQAINAIGPKGGVKRLASQTAGLKTFTSGGKPTGSSPKGRPVRVAPLFKKSASAVQTEEGPGPSTSRAQPRGGGGEEVRSGDDGSLRSCPMCQEQFPPGMSQLDMDGHIAACLSASSEDIMW